MDWLNSKERAWNRGYTKAKEYHAANGNLNVVASYVCDDGFPLGEGLHTHKEPTENDCRKKELNCFLTSVWLELVKYRSCKYE